MFLQVKMLENGRKNLFRDKQTTKKVPLVFFRRQSACGKVTMAFLDAVSKEKRYSVCVYQLSSK